MSSSPYRSVLIVGATGLVGKATTLAYLSTGRYQVGALVRSESATDAKKSAEYEILRAKGVHLVPADFNDVESLKQAVKDYDIVISAVPGNAVPQQHKLLQAVKEVGTVKRFVPSEFVGDVDHPSLKGFPLLVPRQKLRREIEDSGVDYTYIVTGYFYETTFAPVWSGLDLVANKVFVFGDGNAKAAFTAASDFTKVLPQVIENPKSKNAAVHLVGEVLTWNQVIAIYEKVSGRSLERTVIPLATLEAAIKANPSETIIQQIQLMFGKGLSEVSQIDTPQFTSTPFLTVEQYATASLNKQQ